MIDIELFQRNNADNHHTLRIWVASIPVFSDVLVYTNDNLCELRDAITSELKWLNDFIVEEGLKNGK